VALNFRGSIAGPTCGLIDRLVAYRAGSTKIEKVSVIK
jgi:hypothetical protein